MNTIIVVCAVLFTVAVIVAVVFLVNTLLQIKKTAKQVEILLSNLNQEMSVISRITDTVSSFVNIFASPWVKAGSWCAGVVSAFQAKRKKGQPVRPDNVNNTVRS